MLPNLKKLILASFKLVYSHIFTILCLILFVVISYKFEFFFSQKKVFLVSSFSLLFVMHLFAKMRFKIIFTIIFSLIITINFYFAFKLNTYLNAGLFGSIMDTNSSEAASMSKEILGSAIPMLVLSFFLIFMSMRELKKSIIPIKVSIIGLGIFLLVVFPYNAYKYLDVKFGGMRTEISEHPLVVAEVLSQRTAPLLWGNIVTVVNYIDERIKYRNFFNLENKELAAGLELDKELKNNQKLPQKIYLIIGESATRNHLSLYGYSSATSPFVDSLAIHDSTSFRYYEGFSSATITRDAFRQVLTSSTPQNMDAFLKTKSIIDMANDMDYETVWISPFEGVMRQHSGTYLQLLAYSAQHFHYSPSRDDFEYLPLIEESRKNDKKQLILVGLNGSHGAYRDGYDDIDEKALPYNDSLSKDVNDYNRTLHHTDRLLRKVHNEMLKDSSSVMIYFSDHGEIIGKGHGMNQGRAQIEIPLMIFNNSSLDIDSIVDKYKFDFKDRKALNSLTMFYVISELIGYSVSQAEIEHAVHASKYVYFADRSVSLAADMIDGENIN